MPHRHPDAALVGLLPVAVLPGRAAQPRQLQAGARCARCWSWPVARCIAPARATSSTARCSACSASTWAGSRATVAPVIEELLKALVIVLLVRANRIGFLVDAAILGFAVGTGFALVENLYFLHLLARRGHRHLGRARLRHRHHAWRRHRDLRDHRAGADGTAAGAGLAMLAGLLRGCRAARRLQPAGGLAACRHARACCCCVPLLMTLVFKRSERALGEWLGRGFDADAEMLELITSGHAERVAAGPLPDAA